MTQFSFMCQSRPQFAVPLLRKCMLGTQCNLDTISSQYMVTTPPAGVMMIRIMITLLPLLPPFLSELGIGTHRFLFF